MASEEEANGLLVKTVKDAVEHTLIRFGFRVSDGPNEIQEDILFLRRLRLGNPLARLERMELQMAEHEKRDEQRQGEILGKLEDARRDRELVHKRVSDLKVAVASEMTNLKTEVTKKVDEIAGEDGPLEKLRADNRAALLAMLGLAITVIGYLLVRYVFP